MTESMRYRPDEVVSGMLASVELDSFTSDLNTLGEVFKELGERFLMFRAFASADPRVSLAPAAQDALKALVGGGFVQHEAGQRYVLTPQGRAHCITSKQTLFNRADVAQLEEAARLFEARCAVTG